MRRSAPSGLLLLCALGALWLQLLAPVLAATASGALDPANPICSRSSSAKPGRTRENDHRHRGGHCPLCRAGQPGHAVLPLPDTAAGTEPIRAAVAGPAWRPRFLVAAPPAAHRLTQPRAPPAGA